MDPNQQQQQLHVVFLPFLAQGHMIPITDMARLFARHGVKSTIITTPLNAPLFSGKIDRDAQLGLQIRTHVVEFPAAEAGLPEGCENLSRANESFEMVVTFYKSMELLRRPVEELLQQWRPDCLVADFPFHWASESANKLDIPRLYFNATGSFAMCLCECLNRHQPHTRVESDSEPFLLPGLPHEIRVTRGRIPGEFRPEVNDDDPSVKELRDLMLESEVTSYGVVVNSFYELEPGYPEHYKHEMGRKAWFIGPLSLSNKDDMKHKAERGDSAAAIDRHESCLRWLDSKEANSVIYICFGSIPIPFNADQLREIAAALETLLSRQISFIWVVKKEEWLPEGFEERITEGGKGLVIRGWAPQVLILDHGAIGGFVTHCGWNSTLEGVCAGVPMVTWPLQAEQFLNEKLVTDVLKIGVGVGAEEWSIQERKIIVGREEIQSAITRVMVGEEAEEMRSRARKLKEIAVMANEEGGSSYFDMKLLVQELTDLRDKRNNDGCSKS
ncbi:unnamed protein product [Linum trigynum]|uniref:Glycosyltransferase n=1 Tax=Linum trigynum TaxID=586398 RepID=A0AAV2CD82_9ROSI